jgi:hypothetical protein
MITNKELRTWLYGQFPSVGFYGGPSIEVGDLDLHVIVTGLSGAGYDAEHVLDRPGFQLRTIGVQGNSDDAEEFSFQMDRVLTNSLAYPTNIAGKRVVMVNRIGGVPAPLPLDETNRSNFVCSYLIQQEAV